MKLGTALLAVCLLLTACSPATRYARQAQAFLDDGRLPEAVLTYRQALESDPDNPRLLTGLGQALAAQGRARSAAQALGRASRLQPDDASLQAMLAGLIITPQDGLSLKLAWQAEVAADEPVGAAGAAGRVFVAYAGGHLAALAQNSGQIVWQTDTAAVLTSPPAADADQVWIGAADGSILVYAAGSGQTLGRFAAKGAVYAAPALTAQTAYCPSNDGTLYALDRRSLKPVWQVEIGAPLHASPLVTEEAVYIGSNDGFLYAFDAETGERLWPYGILTQGAVESTPTLAGERILLGSGDGRIYALDAETGGEYWRFSTPDAVYARPIVDEGQVITASSGQLLASLNETDGALRWKLTTSHPISETPALFADRLYLSMRGDPRLLAVDPKNGTLLGELNTGDWIAVGPLAIEAGLLIAGKDGLVFLYR